MAEDDDNPMFWIESHDGLLNTLVLLRLCESLFRIVVAGNKVLIKALNVLARLEVVDGFICRNSVEPAEKLACPVEGVKFFKSLDKGCLGDFACIVIVINDPQGNVENLLLVSLDESLERLLVAGNAIFD